MKAAGSTLCCNRVLPAAGFWPAFLNQDLLVFGWTGQQSSPVELETWVLLFGSTPQHATLTAPSHSGGVLNRVVLVGSRWGLMCDLLGYVFV